jgi:hypothetical protein
MRQRIDTLDRYGRAVARAGGVRAARAVARTRQQLHRAVRVTAPALAEVNARLNRDGQALGRRLRVRLAADAPRALAWVGEQGRGVGVQVERLGAHARVVAHAARRYARALERPGFSKPGHGNVGLKSLLVPLAHPRTLARMDSRAPALQCRERTQPRFTGRRATLRMAAILLLGILAEVVVPPLLIVATIQDYASLRTVGEDGLRHLLAAKTDLEALIPADTLGQFAPGSAAGAAAPYTLLIQRQGGTFYGVHVTVHPSPALQQMGVTTAQFEATAGQNVPLPFGQTGGTSASPGGQGGASATSGPTGGHPGGTSGTSGSLIPDPQALARGLGELRAAQQDFTHLRARLDGFDVVLAVAGLVPGLGTQLATARALADVGYDIATVGVELGGVAQPILARLHGGALSGTQDLLTDADLSALRGALAHAQGLLDDVVVKLARVRPGDLPVSAAQKTVFTQALAQVPRVSELLSQSGQWVDAIGWLLGVGQPRHFLVQTLDRSELRPSGGFSGDYGVLTIANGKVGPLALNDVARLDYNGSGYVVGRRPPPQYAWWPFWNWGLRDANLSPDFPTTARLVMQVYHDESGASVDGVIQITPVVIEHLLHLTGPISVPQFGETITAQNLEDKLHYYQLNPAGKAKDARLAAADHSTSQRKLFTQLVGRLLQDRIRHLPPSDLGPVVKQLFADLRAKDIQVYVANPQIEDVLAQHALAGALDTTPGVDGFAFNQANVSAAKSAQFVNVQQQDDVTLDDQGGATHHLTISMHYVPGPDVYGYLTYRAYTRIYVPQQARLDSGDGFDTNTPLCWTPPSWQPGAAKPAQFSGVPDCPADPYPGSELVCASGQYGPGNRPPSVFGSDGFTPWALDALGAPPDQTSDLPGRAMWGGYVTIPPGCTAMLTLSYYVPGVVHLPA